MIRRHYLFYGRVQGVGFRFTTYHLAKKLGLQGGFVIYQMVQLKLVFKEKSK